MAEISLDIVDVHDTADWMVQISGIYSYLHRKPTVAPNIFSYIVIEEQPAFLQKLYAKAFTEYKTLDTVSNRYVEIVPMVKADMANTLEVLNMMSYDKSYTFLYSLLDKLDFVLACIFDDSTMNVRDRLEERCKMFDISYLDLSYAIMSGDINLLKGIDMKVFLNITSNLNNYINDIFINPHTFMYTMGNSTVSLADTAHSPESRIATFIIHKVLFFNQLILNQIIKQFQDSVAPFENSARCMLLSKGTYNIVFTAKHSDFPNLRFAYKNNSTVLTPITYRSLGE